MGYGVWLKKSIGHMAYSIWVWGMRGLCPCPLGVRVSLPGGDSRWRKPFKCFGWWM